MQWNFTKSSEHGRGWCCGLEPTASCFFWNILFCHLVVILGRAHCGVSRKAQAKGQVPTGRGAAAHRLLCQDGCSLAIFLAMAPHKKGGEVSYYYFVWCNIYFEL